MMNERGLMDLKEQIEKAKVTSSELSGKLNHLMEELKGKHGMKSIEGAQIKLKRMEKEMEKAQEQIDAGLEEIGKMKEEEN